MSDSEKDVKDTRNFLKQEGQTSFSRLGSATNFKGELTCQEDVIIEGTFQGKIDSTGHSIHIEKEAHIKADIRGKNIAIMGHVSGNISATNKIFIGKGAFMNGDLSAPRISIQEGAKLKGTVKMLPLVR
jgi:cytoskeletal protein CcmA (bactofilin family)